MPTEKCLISAGFLDHPERPLFHLLLEPGAGDVRGSILFLHPFAEEMHKARRNVAAQARMLATQGYRVVLLDLSGCGDGAGDFADARWQIWLDDARFALDYLRQLHSGPVVLWGLRLGALLAAQLAQSAAEVKQLVLWQPVLNGEQQIDQFLRLRTAAAVMGNDAVFDRKALWSELREGRSLEVAGYELAPALALEIAQARLHDFIPPCPVAWLEIGGVGGSLARPSQNVIAHWEDHSAAVEARTLSGEAFWRNHDAPINGQLLRATREMLA